MGRRSLVQRSVLLPGARAEERTTLYGAILCKGAAARPEAVLNEGTVLGERALAEEKAVLLEGVRLWPARGRPCWDAAVPLHHFLRPPGASSVRGRRGDPGRSWEKIWARRP